MTPAQATCPHERFYAQVNVGRLIDVGQFIADVTIACGACGLPFSFVGPPMGLRFDGPAVNPTRTELRIPIEPGEAALPLEGSMTFQVPRPTKES